MNRRKFVTKASLAFGGITLIASKRSFGWPKEDPIGHNGFLYRIDRAWGELDPTQFPVNDCHEMVMDSQGQIILLTNETKNNVIFYNKDGKYLHSWGTEFPGAHGLTIFKEGGQEMLFITDHDRHAVFKTTIDGKIVMEIGFRELRETGLYEKPEQFKPTETAVAPNGDLYIADGYGMQYFHQFTTDGQYIRSFGGRGDADEQFQTAHGVSVDLRNPKKPTLLLTSRSHNVLKRFTMDGKYMKTIPLPGAYVCRPVIKGDNVYAAVFRSENEGNANSGFVVVLDDKDRLISAPGAIEPVYKGGKLSPMKQAAKDFMHPHDVLVDPDDNIIVCQWNSQKTYPIRLERVK